MTCPLCGETCTCASELRVLANDVAIAPSIRLADTAQSSGSDAKRSELPAIETVSPGAISTRPRFVVSDPNDFSVSSQSGDLEPDPSAPALAESPDSNGASEDPPSADPPVVADLSSQPDLDSWRAEVSARLSRYRARRRPRSPRYPSLRLKFDPPSVRTPVATEVLDNLAAPSASSAPLTCQALAMNPIAEPQNEIEQEQEAAAPLPELPNETVPAAVEPPRAVQVLAKVLEFPRWSYAPPVTANELADPVVERPRILEVPEVVPPPPAMGGITIEDAHAPEPERRPGIDMPLRTAPLGLRVWAVIVDWFVVLLASALFGFLFYRVTGTQPPMWQLIGLGAGLPYVFWASYQYLFTVYCGTTPGLRLAHLRLSRFDGAPVNRSTRRLRVLCGLLSGISLGMGYAWQFLDEDQLCWHERVTRTYLAPPS